MIYAAPAFWAKYRGEVDPQRPNVTPYLYQATFYTTPPFTQLYTASFTVYGPPQLNKRDYVEIRWSPMVGLINVDITRNGLDWWRTNGAEQGTRDEGQYNVINGGVSNQ